MLSGALVRNAVNNSKFGVGARDDDPFTRFQFRRNDCAAFVPFLNFGNSHERSRPRWFNKGRVQTGLHGGFAGGQCHDKSDGGSRVQHGGQTTTLYCSRAIGEFRRRLECDGDLTALCNAHQLSLEQLGCWWKHTEVSHAWLVSMGSFAV